MQNTNIKPGISVVIPNYNGTNLLAQNLPAVFAALQASNCIYEVIISDDASTDDSVAFIRRHYPKVILICSGQNSGFATNINRGIAAAALELVLLLNSDIKLSKSYFKTQLKYFNKPDTFGVMGQVYDDVTGAVVEACKYPLPSLFKINHFKNIAVNSSAEVYSYYLSGANALVNRQKLKQLHGFNEIFSPFYHEDLDLSLRAWESGWKCYYDHEAICRHAVSATIKAHSSKKKIKTISTRNKLLLHYFHLQRMRLYLWFAFTTFSLLFRWVSGKWYYYKAYRLFLQKIGAMHTYKQQFKQNAIQKQGYIPYTRVKKMIKNAIDQVLKADTR